MKYEWSITILLAGLFLLSQVAGLGILLQDLEEVQTPSGEIKIVHGDTAIGPRPEVNVESGESVLFILFGVLIGTVLLLGIIRFGKVNLWKIMFFIAILTTITISIGVFVDPILAVAIALVLTVLKIFKHHIVIHNATEVLIYAGIAVLFVPLFNIFWIVILLIIISGYDAFAVWQSRHMVKLAKFQIGTGLFAGLLVRTGKRQKGKGKRVRVSGKGKSRGGEAILGGGDIAFPLIFAGVVMESLVPAMGKVAAFGLALIIPLVLTLVLLALLIKGRQGHFYPAMPFLTAGCLIGLGIVTLVMLF